MSRYFIATAADRIVPGDFIRGDRLLVQTVIETLAAGHPATCALRLARRLSLTRDLVVCHCFNSRVLTCWHYYSSHHQC